MARGTSGIRHAEVSRESASNKIYVNLDFDGGTRQDIDTGVQTFDWAIKRLADKGRLDLGINCERTGSGAIVDSHTLVEEVGICLGQAIRKALADHSVARTSSFHMPCDDALVLVAVNMGGSAYLSFDADFNRERVGDLPTEHVREFLRALAHNAGMNLHVRKVAGINDHHLLDAIFQGLGAALQAAATPTETNSKQGSGRMR